MVFPGFSALDSSFCTIPNAKNKHNYFEISHFAEANLRLWANFWQKKSTILIILPGAHLSVYQTLKVQLDDFVDIKRCRLQNRCRYPRKRNKTFTNHRQHLVPATTSHPAISARVHDGHRESRQLQDPRTFGHGPQLSQRLLDCLRLPLKFCPKASSRKHKTIKNGVSKICFT